MAQAFWLVHAWYIALQGPEQSHENQLTSGMESKFLSPEACTSARTSRDSETRLCGR